MHVCIQVALRGIAHGIGQSNWAWGGAHQKVGPMSQHRGYISPASRPVANTCTLGVLSVTNFTLGS